MSSTWYFRLEASFANLGTSPTDAKIAHTTLNNLSSDLIFLTPLFSLDGKIFHRNSSIDFPLYFIDQNHIIYPVATQAIPGKEFRVAMIALDQGVGKLWTKYILLPVFYGPGAKNGLSIFKCLKKKVRKLIVHDG